MIQFDLITIYILQSTAQINSGDRSDQPHSGIGQEIQSISSPIGADNEQKLLLFVFEKSLDALVTRGCFKKIEIGRRFNTISNSEANDNRESMRFSNLLKTVTLSAAAAAAVAVAVTGYQWLFSS